MKSVRDARKQGPLPVVPILPPRPSAPVWDPYSPVALVLWRAADFAEAGSTSPCLHASRDLDAYGDVWFQAACYSDRLYQTPETPFPLPPLAWAVSLRQIAEFGPAGRRP